MQRSSTAPVRLVDVAAKAGVSATVVSAVLRSSAGGTVRVSEATAKRVRKIAQEMGYRPNVTAQQLKGRTGDVIGVLIGASSTAANWERLWRIEQEAYRRGYRLMIGQFHDDAERAVQYVQDFVSRGVEAMICFHNPLPRNNPPLMDWFSRIRALVFQTEAILPGALCVDVDRAQGVREAVGHLVKSGRQRIALVLNSWNDPLMQDRLRGYTAGLKDHKRQVQKELIFAGDGTFPPTRELLGSAVEKVAIAGGADAIVASNDIWAIELIKAMRRRGISVPGQMAVIGFDNLPSAALFDPELTTIDQNNDDFAIAAIDLVDETLKGKPIPPARRKRIVKPRLVVRESA